MQTITAGLPTKDGCPILTRLKAFIVDQSTVVKLEHVVRDRNGNPFDLSQYLPVPNSDSGSDSDSDNVQDGSGKVIVRFREFTGTGIPTCNDPLWQELGAAVDAAAGTVSVVPPRTLMARSGIYEVNWGVENSDGDLVLADRSLLSVERSLFGYTSNKKYMNDGPPTIQEIRMLIMDSAPSENLLLDDVEFADEQILLAITRPLQIWNETPPPIEIYSTRTFPWRGAWVDGILAELYQIAAAHYRRNRLQTSAAGVDSDTKNKEREYLAASQFMTDKFMTWLRDKKVSINMKKFNGSSISEYSRRSGWEPE